MYRKKYFINLLEKEIKKVEKEITKEVTYCTVKELKKRKRNLKYFLKLLQE